MKKTVTSTLMAFAFVGFMGVSSAEDTAKPAANPHDHASAPAADAGAMGGHMKMDEMHGMMQECMKNHKDGKMCSGQVMEKCQANMKADDCKKMMKKMKK